LAKHKTPHKDFKPERPIQTPISHAAMKAEASERIMSLSTPKPRDDGPFREPKWGVCYPFIYLHMLISAYQKIYLYLHL
jgi:hypothetical protein